MACSIKGCGRDTSARGWCKKHYMCWYRYGDPEIVYPNVGNGADNSNWHGIEVTYTGAHARVKALWGPARNYFCIDCNNTAAQWAYDGTDYKQLWTEPEGRKPAMAYSAYPEFYMPMCSSCHHRRDKSIAAAELAEYRSWKRATGMSLERIPEPNYRPTAQEEEEYLACLTM